MKKKANLIVGLDIGTTKICVLIGRIKGKEIEIIGMGRTPSRGLNKGVITDIEEASRAIKKALREAEFDAGLKIKRGWTSIGGAHIQGRNHRGFVKVKRDDKVITFKDKMKVLEEASHPVMGPDREIIHVLPWEYIVDGQDQVKEPVGMSGNSLEVRVYIVSASSACCQNIENSIRRGGYEVEGMVLQSLASSMATLLPEEKELGVLLLDIGGGTTDLAIFLNGELRFARVLATGGNYITNDIAVAFHTTREKAESIKLKYGRASLDFEEEDEMIRIEKVAGRGSYTVKRKDLIKVIQMRVDEIFELVDEEIRKSGLRGLVASGVVLTGGCSLLEGIKERAERKLKLPVRIGYPRINHPEKIVNPIYATAIGLIFYGLKAKEESIRRERGMVKIKEWFRQFF